MGERKQFLKESASQGLAGLVTLIALSLKFNFIPGFVGDKLLVKISRKE